MSDETNPFAAMMAQMQEMAKAFPQMGAFDPSKGFDPKAMEAMWPTMPKEVMETWFGNALNENGLDAKTRLLITLAGLTMQGAQADSAIRQTVRHAREAGATDQQISETLGMMAVFAGVPAMTRAMELAQEVMTDSEDKT
ncbi:MAG: carboxymuconolactone decarboxylase family protein [Tateyamaria sp.]|jgi:4-carboxymuconolactone decarboxylase|uniref:carboxymuconolactone decarboxylase family protein n=1 Tax=unclassified Tateyamaria TaxID=2645127 RepID=UPI000D55B275|nr:carboxymuconolactone decarboxylase family protein [Tateyamaria sp. Alg231-49]